MERLTVTSAKRPEVKYDFGKDFYKFPAYYRRAAIAESLGCVSSYRSRIKNWEAEDIRTRGRNAFRYSGKGAGNGIWTFRLRKKQNFMIHRQRTSWSLPRTLASTTHVPAVCLQRTARSQEGASFPSLQKTTASKKPPAGSIKHSVTEQKGCPTCGHVQKASVMPSR